MSAPGVGEGLEPLTCAQAGQVTIAGRRVALNVTDEDEAGRFAVFRVVDHEGPLDIEIAEGESADVPGLGAFRLLRVTPSAPRIRGAAVWVVEPAT